MPDRRVAVVTGENDGSVRAWYPAQESAEAASDNPPPEEFIGREGQVLPWRARRCRVSGWSWSLAVPTGPCVCET